MMLGHEFAQCPEFSFFERMYIRIFGMPILGLRIRAWRMMPLIKKYAANARNVLDMGSGRGVFTIEIAKNLPESEVLGVEKEYTHKVNMAQEVAQKLRLHNCSFEMVDIFDNQFDTTFDAIISIDVLEHVKHDLEVTQKLYGLLHEGGKLIVHVPHYYRNIFGITRLNFPDIEGHERIGYRLEEIENLLVNAKFRIVEKGYTYSSWETLANDISYLITGGREKRKFLYSLAFPVLLCLAYLGKYSTPSYGSGVYIIGKKEV